MKIMIYVMAYRAPANSFLMRWLFTHKIKWRIGSQEFGIDVARNQNVNRFLREDVPEGYTHLVMLDSDAIPIIETNALLNQPGDLIYCGYTSRGGSRAHVDSFGAGCFRASANCLQTIEAPYFRFSYTDTHDKLLACECDYFATKAIQAGFQPQKVGVIGHQMGGESGIVLFPADNKTGFQFCWPHELPFNQPK